MDARATSQSSLTRFVRTWRREILRGAVMFAAVLGGGLFAVHFFRSFAAGWGEGGDGVGPGDDRGWQEAFQFSDVLAPGERVWLRNRSGAVMVAPAQGESLLVIAEKSWRRSSPASVEIVAVPHPGGVTICALWDAEATHCRPEGGYTVARPRSSDVNVRFLVHVPRGVAVDASTVNGLIEISGVAAPVRAKTVNGKIQAHVLEAPFRAETVNGEIEAALAFSPRGLQGEVSLETVNGSIAAALAPDVNAELEASTVNGKIATEYPIGAGGRITSRRVTGRLGTGGPTLRFSAVNGSIQISELHGAPPPRAPAPQVPSTNRKLDSRTRVAP